MARQSRTLRILGIVLIVVALLIAMYSVVAYVALESGRIMRAERLREEQAAELSNQLTHAREDIGAGNFSLASRRLEWILERDPDNTEARALLAGAQEALTGTRGPSESSGDEATATPEITPLAAGAGDEAAAAELQRLEALVEAESWEQAITALISFQYNYPDYERRMTDELLYESYIAQGVDLLYGDQVEVGLYYLEQAQRLGDLSQEVRDQKEWAELYLAGMGYFGVNWDVSLFYFRDLCLAAPFFHDACDKLYEALVAYGDQYAAQQEWCPAEGLYNEAYNHDDSDALLTKLQNARQGCQEATPTPSAPISGTLPVTGTTPVTDTLSPDSGFRVP